jgi:ketosteroid isomerase-like protein
VASNNILKTIEHFWQVRSAGDKEGVQSLLAPDATYEMPGAKAFAAFDAVGPGPAALAADRLINDFKFHDVKQLSAIVDGNRAAVVNRIIVSFRDGEAITTEMCDLWEFDASGKIASLRQFVDTDLVRRMMGAPS